MRLYIGNRAFQVTMGLKGLAYDLMIVLKIEIKGDPISIIKFVIC